MGSPRDILFYGSDSLRHNEPWFPLPHTSALHPRLVAGAVFIGIDVWAAGVPFDSAGARWS
jgi:hypothetical protein